MVISLTDLERAHSFEVFTGIGGGKRNWIYSESNKFLSVTGISNHVNMVFNLDSKYDIDNKLSILRDSVYRGECSNDALMELEEKLRTLSNFVIGGKEHSLVGLSEGARLKRKKGKKYYTYDENGTKVEHIARGPVKVPTEAQKRAAANARKYAHTGSADAKRRKTIKAKGDAKVLGL